MSHATPGHRYADGVGDLSAAGSSAGGALAILGDVTFGAGAGFTLNGGAMSVTGTLTGGFDGVHRVMNGGSLTAGALAGNASTFLVSAGSGIVVTGGVSGLNPEGSYYLVSGAHAKLKVEGSFVSDNDTVAAQNAGKIQLASLREDSSGDGVTLSADGSSSIEIGTKGGVAAGAITIDAGVSVTEAGSLEAPLIVDKGTLAAGAGQFLVISGKLELDGTLSVGAGGLLDQFGPVTGGGKATIGAGASLGLIGDDTGSAIGIAFTGPGGQLALDTSDIGASGQFAPAISGFDASGSITFTDYGATVTAAHYAGGVLRLYAGHTVVAALKIGTGYTDAFSVVLTGDRVTVQVNYLGSGTHQAPPGTTAADTFLWTGPAAGYWDNAANWSDISAGQDPASVPPGAMDTVTVAAAANDAAQVLIGNAGVHGMTLLGQTLLDGVFQVAGGGLGVGPGASAILDAGSTLSVTGDATFGDGASLVLNGGTMSASGTFHAGEAALSTLDNAGSLSVGAFMGDATSLGIDGGSEILVRGDFSDADGNGSGVLVDGAHSKLKVEGSLVSSSDGITSLDGGKVQRGALREDAAGNGISLTADSASSIELGAKGGVAAGAITIDSGVSVTEAGNLDAPMIVNNGHLSAGTGQSLAVSGTLAGSGTIGVGAGSTVSLDLDGVLGTGRIAFAGAGGTVDILSAATSPNLDLSGFMAGDMVALSGAWSLLGFSENAAHTLGTLTLSDGTHDVGLGFSGDFTAGSFAVTTSGTTLIGHT